MTTALAPSRSSSRRKLMATLFAAQVCGSTGHSMSLAVGAIMAAAITGTNTWSGMPVAVAALGAALASWPLSRLMQRAGRRARDGRRRDRQLRRDARGDDALRHRQHVEPPRALRGRGHHARRAARARDG